MLTLVGGYVRQETHGRCSRTRGVGMFCEVEQGDDGDLRFVRGITGADNLALRSSLEEQFASG